MITMLIIDDHPLVGDGIAAMIKDIGYLQISGICKNARAALDFLAGNAPDIILLDMNLPDMDGLELCSRIRTINGLVKIIALTSTNEAAIITQLLGRGGNGYLLKEMEREDLVNAIDAVLDNKVYLSKAANQKILEQFRNIPEAIRNIPILTRREKEILHLLYEGLKVPQIADRIFLSPYTVETHKKNLMQKMKAGSTQQLLKVARENGLLNT